jgi:hypothetical protein
MSFFLQYPFAQKSNMRTFMNNQDTARKLWLVNYEVRYAAVDVSGAEGASV